MSFVTASVSGSTTAPTLNRLESFSFCPACLTREFFQPIDRERTWMHCSKLRTAQPFIACPACSGNFEFLGQPRCPVCQTHFADGVPLAPNVERKRAWDRLVKSRGAARDLERQQADSEFAALYASWRQESSGAEQVCQNQATRLGQDLGAVRAHHRRLLDDFETDVERFLYGAPIRLARFEAEYSWKFDQELGREVDQLLEGMLRGKEAVRVSLPFLARYRQRLPQAYSRMHLDAELKRRFDEHRQVPRPGFQLTLEYARTLSGLAFEEWLARLLREAGIPGVSITQASRDQGADLVIVMETRKIEVQAKQCQDTIGNSAVQQAYGALRYYGANEAWVVTTSEFSKDAIDLAYKTGVGLVSGNQLMNLPTMLLEGNSDSPEPVESADQNSCAPDTNLPTSIAPAAKVIVAETFQMAVQKSGASLVLRNWKAWQTYAAGAAIFFVVLLLADLARGRGIRLGSRAIGTRVTGNIQQGRVPTAPLRRPGRKEQPQVTLKTPPSAFKPSESGGQETTLTSYAPGKFSHWYVIEKAHGNVTVLNRSYTHVHIVSDASVQVDMSDCHSVPTVYFDCDNRAGAVTITDLSGTAGNHLLLELR